MKSVKVLATLALGIGLLAAAPAGKLRAAQSPAPPPLQLDVRTPAQEAAQGQGQAPAQGQAQTRTDSAAAPALPPLTAGGALQSEAAQNAQTARSAQAEAVQSSQSAQGAPARAESAQAPLPDIGIHWGGYFQALAVLCLALAALWALLWFFKRRGGLGAFMTPGDQVMRIESRLALGPKKWILVARYMGRRLVIGVTDQNISLLTEFYDQAEEKDETARSAAARGGTLKDGAAVDDGPLPELSFASLPGMDHKKPDAG